MSESNSYKFDGVKCAGVYGKKCGFNHKLRYHTDDLKYGRCKTCAPKYEECVLSYIENLENRQSRLKDHLKILKADFVRNITKTNNQIQQNVSEISELRSILE